MLSDIPPAVLQKHPELLGVGEAYFAGEPVTAHCTICNQPLTVTHIEATESVWVICPNKCTFFHAIGEKTGGQ